jgi:hypothetical protein
MTAAKEALSIDRNDLENISIEDLWKLRQDIMTCTMEFMRMAVKSAQKPPDREVAEYVANKLGMPVELVERVRDGMDQELKKEWGLQ